VSIRIILGVAKQAGPNEPKKDRSDWRFQSVSSF